MATMVGFTDKQLEVMATGTGIRATNAKAEIARRASKVKPEAPETPKKTPAKKAAVKKTPAKKAAPKKAGGTKED